MDSSEITRGYTEIDRQADHLQDLYTVMYGFVGRSLCERLGFDGEAALREATRRYGIDRGTKDRQAHLDAGCRVNVYNAFNVGAGLPGNKRTISYRFESTPRSHRSHVLTCPMAEIWDRTGCFDIGRIYCEEFHFAYYNSYGFNKTRVDLATTLTERGARYCSFNVRLNPDELPAALRPLCFDEYAKEPEAADLSCFKPRTAQQGYRSLYLRLYIYLYLTAREQLGQAGCDAVCKGLNEMAAFSADYLKQRAAAGGRLIDDAYLRLNYPASLAPDTDLEPGWDAYPADEAKINHMRYLAGPLKQKLGVAIK